MSFMNPVDNFEEDAADLLFPKAIVSENKANKFIKARGGGAAGSSRSMSLVKPNAATRFVVAYCAANVLETENVQRLYGNAKSNTDVLSSESDSFEYCGCCVMCAVKLKEPYIKCFDCSVVMCLQCFACGRENVQHLNNHAYIVVQDDIQVFTQAVNWTAREERILLKTLARQGYGNWSAVARELHWRHSANECKQHYHDCYFGRIFERLLGLSHHSQIYFPQRMPYAVRMRSLDPPRHDDISSMQFKTMAGYRAARGDFDTPYDVSAEGILTAIELISSQQDEDEECDALGEWTHIEQELQCALVRAYNHRLSERQRRYRIMRDHGLIVNNRTLRWISKYVNSFGSDSNCHRFLSFMQICHPIKFDMLVESMQYFADLQKALFRLFELRHNGVRTSEGGALYFKCKKKRLIEQRFRSKDDRTRQMYDWRKLQTTQTTDKVNIAAGILQTQTMHSNRRKAGPMDIIGLPGYTKLNEEERKLCSKARLAPQAYIDYKTLLIAENALLGAMRLADARRLMKIDVNKTRQVYDFLLEHGHINRPAA